MYKILSLNGGGIRGIITAGLLEKIEEDANKPISQCFDLIVGTSSGAIIGAALVQGLSAKRIKELFIEERHAFFDKNKFSFNGLLKAKYNSKTKEDKLKELLDSSTQLCDYAFTSFDLRNRVPIIFNSIEDISSLDYCFTTKANIYEAVCASSAAPVFWEPYNYQDKYTLVDGAFCANDPTDVGVKLALGNKVDYLSDLLIVNIGTGMPTRDYSVNKSGALSWLLPSFDLFLGGQPQITKMLYLSENVNYLTLDAKLHSASDSIDDISNINLARLELMSQHIYDTYYSNIKELIGIYL